MDQPKPQPLSSTSSVPSAQPMVATAPQTASTAFTPNGEVIMGTGSLDSVCPKCHLPVRKSDYFCSNCGAEIHKKPPSISVVKQLSLYIGSLILPPFGIIWGARYIREGDEKGKIVGWICVGLTLIALIITAIITIQVLNMVNEQISNQMSAVQAL